MYRQPSVLYREVSFIEKCPLFRGPFSKVSYLIVSSLLFAGVLVADSSETCVPIQWQDGGATWSKHWLPDPQVLGKKLWSINMCAFYYWEHWPLTGLLWVQLMSVFANCGGVNVVATSHYVLKHSHKFTWSFGISMVIPHDTNCPPSLSSLSPVRLWCASVQGAV